MENYKLKRVGHQTVERLQELLRHTTHECAVVVKLDGVNHRLAYLSSVLADKEQMWQVSEPYMVTNRTELQTVELDLENPSNLHALEAALLDLHLYLRLVPWDLERPYGDLVVEGIWLPEQNAELGFWTRVSQQKDLEKMQDLYRERSLDEINLMGVKLQAQYGRPIRGLHDLEVDLNNSQNFATFMLDAGDRCDQILVKHLQTNVKGMLTWETLKKIASSKKLDPETVARMIAEKIKIQFN